MSSPSPESHEPAAFSSLLGSRILRNEPGGGDVERKTKGTAGKKPPARSVRRRAARPTTKAQIAAEIHQALEDLGAGPELLAIVGSWGDILDDAAVLRLLRDHNAGRPTFLSLL